MNGYNEIQNPPERYGVIDQHRLQYLCGFSDSSKFAEQYGRWVQEAIAEVRMKRESCWTESIAVGSKEFIEETKVKQGISAKGRRIDEKPDGLCVLRETSVPYSAAFDPEIGALRAENAFFLKHF